MTTIYSTPMFVRGIVPIALAEYFKSDVKYVDMMEEPEEFVKNFPLKQTPALINKEKGVYLTESLAITHYIVKTYGSPEEIEKLIGKTPLEQAEILRWESYALSDYLIREAKFVMPLIGYYPYDPKTYPEAKKRFEVAVQVYEDHLSNHEFLVGDHITLGDLLSASSFAMGFKHALDPNWSQNYPNIMKWYTKVADSPYLKEDFKNRKQCQKFPSLPNSN